MHAEVAEGPDVAHTTEVAIVGGEWNSGYTLMSQNATVLLCPQSKNFVLGTSSLRVLPGSLKSIDEIRLSRVVIFAVKKPQSCPNRRKDWLFEAVSC
jgi:hypothetical protein